jgi:hypothetical protein
MGLLSRLGNCANVRISTALVEMEREEIKAEANFPEFDHAGSAMGELKSVYFVPRASRSRCRSVANIDGAKGKNFRGVYHVVDVLVFPRPYSS